MTASTTSTTPYSQALAAIWQRSAYDRGYIANPFAGDTDAALGLRRTERLLEHLGRPQNQLRILHVAGSKGKGSTCAFAASMLTAAGERTGRYTSPHLHSFRERIAIDSVEISADEFAALFERVFIAVHEVEAAAPEFGEITAFELATAAALVHFADRGCTSAVVEVGLGGTLDATNVVMPIASLISTLDYEHTKVLGNTIAEIAANKAGIIKAGTPIATVRQDPDAMAVIERTAREQSASLLVAARDWQWSGSWREFRATGPWGTFDHLRTGLIGDHQADNACLAIVGCWLLLGDSLTEEAVRAGLAATRWPGRFEIVATSPYPLVLDGAHTPAAARALSQAVTSEFPGISFTIVLGVLRDKDVRAIVTALAPIAERIVAITPPGPRGLPAAEMVDALAGLAMPIEAATVETALELAQRAPAVVTGSLSTVAVAREALGLATPDPITLG